jgi:hypothetical protein
MSVSALSERASVRAKSNHLRQLEPDDMSNQILPVIWLHEATNWSHDISEE